MRTPRFSPFPHVSSKYGAPMGRGSNLIDPSTPLDRLCVSFPQGEYDSGGAYWGNGGSEGSVYAVWERGKGHETVCYVRARGTESAKRKALDL